MTSITPRPRADAAWSWPRLRSLSLAETRRVLGPSALAEDAAQEAVLRAWRYRHSCRTPDHPEPWVRSIARREALRLVARDRDAADLDETGATAPAELEDDAIRRLDLRRALASVPPADRDLLVGRYWQDLSDGDLARRLGVAEATVRVRLHRVRARLRDGW